MAKSQFAQYFKSLSQKEKTNSNTFSLIKLLGYAPGTPIFNFVESNTAAFNKTVGLTVINDYIRNTYQGYLRGMALEKGAAARKDYFVVKEKFIAKKFSFSDEVTMYASVYETFDSTGKVDIKEYQARGTAFLDKYGRNSDFYAIGLTSLLGNCTGRENEGAAGIQWMEDLLARKREPRYLNTYFYILWRNHQFDKAITVGEEMKAIAMAKNEPVKDIESQIAMVVGYKETTRKKKLAGN
jgi:hypothetical protein